MERKIAWQIAGKRGTIKALAEGVGKEAIKAVEKAKASVRTVVEHPFHIVTNLFRRRKVKCRGLANVVIGSRTATKPDLIRRSKPPDEVFLAAGASSVTRQSRNSKTSPYSASP